MFRVKEIRRIALVGILFLFVGIFLFGSKGYINQVKMKNRIKWLEKEISRLKEENHLLEKEKRELNSDPYRVEMEARKLGMVREGEWVVEFRPKRR